MTFCESKIRHNCLGCCCCCCYYLFLPVEQSLPEAAGNLLGWLVLEQPKHPQDPEHRDIGLLLADVDLVLGVNLGEDIAQDLLKVDERVLIPIILFYAMTDKTS